jgi:hypothetical protein
LYKSWHLKLALFNFDSQPREVGLRLWELDPGRYRVGDREMELKTRACIRVTLPSQRLETVEVVRVN